MKYVALLRGINVGGKNIIKMTSLKTCFEENGFFNVKTFIQSGNVIFESNDKNIPELEKKIEKILDKTFNYTSKVMVRSLPQLRQVLYDAPEDWGKREDIRKYIAFLKGRIKSNNAIEELELREGVDSVKAREEVVYLTSLLSELTKSKLNRLASMKIYQDMTIRNYNTTRKIAALMEDLGEK